MRAAYVCPDPGVPVFGRKGCSVHVQEVLRELIERGTKVDLFAARVGGDTPFPPTEVRLYELPPCDAPEPSQRVQQQLRNELLIEQMLADHGPYDLIYERHALYASAAMRFARRSRTPGILEVNAPLIEEQARYRQLVQRSLAVQALREAVSTAAAVVAVSEEVADYVRSHRRQPAGVYVLPNGVDVRRFAPGLAPAAPAPAGFVTIGFVGTLKPWHGVGHLIDAFAQVAANRTNVRLLLVGDGPQRDALQQQRAQLPPSIAQRIEFTGSAQPEQIPGLLASFDVAVAPYTNQETFYFSPLKLFEYMAAGLPTVASRVGQIAEVVIDQTGILYPAGDQTALASALELLCARPDVRKTLGDAARQHVSQSYTWKAIVDQILEIAARNAPQRTTSLDTTHADSL